MENAIKHNEISSEKPLKIRIYENHDYLIVENELHPKQIYEKSLGIGLSNIRERYKLLTQKEMIVNKDDHHFSVKIPIIREINH